MSKCHGEGQGHKAAEWRKWHSHSILDHVCISSSTFAAQQLVGQPNDIETSTLLIFC